MSNEQELIDKLPTHFKEAIADFNAREGWKDELFEDKDKALNFINNTVTMTLTDVTNLVSDRVIADTLLVEGLEEIKYARDYMNEKSGETYVQEGVRFSILIHDLEDERFFFEMQMMLSKTANLLQRAFAEGMSVIEKFPPKSYDEFVGQFTALLPPKMRKDGEMLINSLGINRVSYSVIVLGEAPDRRPSELLKERSTGMPVFFDGVVPPEIANASAEEKARFATDPARSFKMQDHWIKKARKMIDSFLQEPTDKDGGSFSGAN